MAEEEFADIFDDGEEVTGVRPRKRRGPQPPRQPWRAPEVRPAADPEPVELFHELDHDFVKKIDGKRGCAECGEFKKWMGHHAYPESFNAGGSSRNPNAWQSEKKLWMDFFEAELDRLALPIGLGRVMVEGTLCFPTRRMNRGPDQGNYRHPIEKHLGDALVNGGWLKDDNWLAYSFGNLGWTYEKGRRWMRLTFFTAWTEQGVPEAAQGTLL